MYGWIEKAKTIFSEKFNDDEDELVISLPPSGSNEPEKSSEPMKRKVKYMSTSSLQEAQTTALNLVLNKSRIEMEILQQLCFDGIPERPRSLKAKCWKVLLGYLPLERDEWENTLRSQRQLYAAYLSDLFPNPVESSSQNEDKSSDSQFVEVDPAFDPLSDSAGVWREMYIDLEMKKEIEKDIKRTHQTLAFFHLDLPMNSKSREFECNFNMEKEKPTHLAVMTRILLLFAKLNPGVKYVQGMNELLSPIYYIFSMDDEEDSSAHAEADSFFCFMSLMSFLQDRFIKDCDNSQIGMNACLEEFDTLLREVDEPVSDVFIMQGMDSRYYALRWLSVLLAMEFEFPDVLRLWDSFLSDPNKFHFVTIFSIAMIVLVRDQILVNDFAQNMQLMQHFQEKNEFIDINRIFKKALALQRTITPDKFQGVSRI